MQDLFEIAKYTLPSTTIFVAVYFILRKYLAHQYSLELMTNQKEKNKDLLFIKIQAYERLAMFCERISIDNLYYRLLNKDMGVHELRNAMLIAVQQEYEHNLTQQIYISQNLWQIIKLTKDQTQEIISKSDGSNPLIFLGDIKNNISSLKIDPVSYAKQAIKNEVDVLLV